MSEEEMQLRLFRDTEYDLRFNGTETKTGPQEGGELTKFMRNIEYDLRFNGTETKTGPQEGGELTKFMRNMVKIPKVKIPKVSLLKKSEEEV